MSDELSDIIVVGLGVAGEEVAGKLAEAGLDVVGIEADLVGGECPYWGCIPSKMAIRSANLIAESERIDGIAGRAHAIPDWSLVSNRIRDEATDDWDDRVARERLIDKGVTFVDGRARLIEPGRVRVGKKTYGAHRGIVLGTGASAVIPAIPGLADTPYWTNRDVLEAKTLPDSLIVLGGGAIGMELAQALARFGTEVTVIEGSDRLLPSEEPESSKLIEQVFDKQGVVVKTSNKAVNVSFREVFTITLDSAVTVSGEQLLVSVGRRPDLAKLGVDAIGLDPRGSQIDVDTRMRAADKVWAVGDVTGHGAFTHVAMYQAKIAIADILGRELDEADYRAVPRVTFTDPEIASVGMTQSQAEDAGISVAVGTASVPSTARGWIHKAGNRGLIKLIVDADRSVLVGATSVGPTGGEVLGLLTLAIHAEIPIRTLRHMIYAYPTFHRGIEDALNDLD